MTDTYIENLKIGGGKGAAACGNSPAGGATIANNGDFSTDGVVLFTGALSLGKVGDAGELKLVGSTSGAVGITTDATASIVISDKPIAAKTSVQLNGSTSGTATLAVDATTTKATLDKPLEVTGGITATTALTGATLAIGGGYGATGATIAATGNIQTNGTALVEGVLTLGVVGDAGNRIILMGIESGSATISINTTSGSVTINKAWIANNGLTAGVSGSVAGILRLYRGANTNTPGYVAFTDSGGTVRNFWASTTSGVRIHTSTPAENTDGAPVSWSGSEIHYSSLATAVSVTLTNQSTWYPHVQFTAAQSVSVGSDTTTTVTGGPPSTAAYITAVTAGTYLVTLMGGMSVNATGQELHIGVGIDGADPTGKLIGSNVKPDASAFPDFFCMSAIVTLTAGQVLRPCFYNTSSAGKIVSFEGITLRAQRIA